MQKSPAVVAELRHEGTGKSPYKTAPKKNDNQIFPNLYEIFLFLNITPVINVRIAFAGWRGRATVPSGDLWSPMTT